MGFRGVWWGLNSFIEFRGVLLEFLWGSVGFVVIVGLLEFSGFYLVSAVFMSFSRFYWILGVFWG